MNITAYSGSVSLLRRLGHDTLAGEAVRGGLLQYSTIARSQAEDTSGAPRTCALWPWISCSTARKTRRHFYYSECNEAEADWLGSPDVVVAPRTIVIYPLDNFVSETERVMLPDYSESLKL